MFNSLCFGLSRGVRSRTGFNSCFLPPSTYSSLLFLLLPPLFCCPMPEQPIQLQFQQRQQQSGSGEERKKGEGIKKRREERRLDFERRRDTASGTSPRWSLSTIVRSVPAAGLFSAAATSVTHWLMRRSHRQWPRCSSSRRCWTFVTCEKWSCQFG